MGFKALQIIYTGTMIPAIERYKRKIEDCIEYLISTKTINEQDYEPVHTVLEDLYNRILLMEIESTNLTEIEYHYKKLELEACFLVNTNSENFKSWRRKKRIDSVD